MKLTEENADYQDCRPLIEAARDELIPDHIRARRAPREAAGSPPDTEAPTNRRATWKRRKAPETIN
jgi:hypothetical protein